MNQITLIWILIIATLAIDFFLVYQMGKIVALRKYIEVTINELSDELEEGESVYNKSKYEINKPESGIAPSTGLEETD